MSNDYPKLRFVEALPIEPDRHLKLGANAEPAFVLRDPTGIADNLVVVSAHALFVLQFFDGNHSLLDIRAKFLHTFGTFLPEEKLKQLVAALEQAYLLETQNFQDYLKRLERQMMEQPVRQAAHAGISYEADPTRLRGQLDGFYQAPEGAGLPNPANNMGKTRILAAIAPHIDLRVGGACYTFTYRHLAESAPAEIYVILGTGHSGLINCFSCLPKDFETPLGVVRHDAEFIAELRRRHPYDLLAEPLSHRTEHTIEFQTIFLQHLFGGKREFAIIPILCSYAYPMLTDARFGREKKIILSFIEALRETIAVTKRRVCVIASVDLSHVGPRYGDPQPPDSVFLQRVTEADHQLLATLEEVNASKFVAITERLQDRYRVCGFAPLHTMLAATEAKRGQTLKYERGVVDDRHSIVTFASAILI
ncbi:MAG: AmmeMemoRadiSam system protein B [candidate division KSB1 bacterium]|nr:AmmeMemoRadiSam system protein B [candidate division KSB1 bacterium]